MTKLSLPEMSLVCVDSVCPQISLRAIRKCLEVCTFGRTMLLTSVDGISAPDVDIIPIRQLDYAGYSEFMVKDLVNYFETDYVLVVQWDGFVVNKDLWQDDFFKYDYIGAVWPWYKDGYRVGNGGFSLRSRKLQQALLDDRIVADTAEDGVICRIYRRLLEDEYGIVFAPEDVAEKFSYEGIDCNPIVPQTFGFHGVQNLYRYYDQHELADIIPQLITRSLTAKSCVRLVLDCLIHDMHAASRAWLDTVRQDHSEEQILAMIFTMTGENAALADHFFAQMRQLNPC